MGVERIDYSSDEEQEQEPNIVPCFKCGIATYQISDVPEENLCIECSKAKNK